MVLEGDALEVLRGLPCEFFDCMITSPPYWGLRDYGLEPLVWDGVEGCEHEWGDEHIHKTDLQAGNPEFQRQWREQASGQSSSAFCSLCGAWRGSLGLEPTFQLYISHLMQIFDEVKRVLKPGGTCWVVMGDSYAGSGKGIGTDRTKCKESYTDDNIAKTDWCKCKVQAKSLCQIPSRFAIAMTDAGWILRNEIIWWKRNCMPTSVKDRFTVDFEKVFFFVKQKKYWFEQQMEPTITRDNGCKNMRCVWDIPTKPFKDAHFAVFPLKLVEPMLSAGCPVDGWVLDPFAGAATVGVVAKAQDKNFIGIELNPEYIEMAERRIDETVQRT